MSRDPQQRETSDIARSFFLQAVGLFLAMLLPFAVLDGFEISLAVVAILATYLIGAVYLKSRGQPKAEPEKKTEPRDNTAPFVFLLYLGGGFLAVSGFSGLIVILCMGFAYRGTDGDLLVLDETALGGLGPSTTGAPNRKRRGGPSRKSWRR